MATNSDAPSFDEMDTGSEAPSGNRQVDLGPGETVKGRLLFRFSFVGQYDNDQLVIQTDDGLVSYEASSGSVIRQLNAQDVEPECWIGLRKSEEQQTFENDDGEEISYHPVEVRSGAIEE